MNQQQRLQQDDMPPSHILQSHIVVSARADGRYGHVDFCGSAGACRAFAAHHGGSLYLNPQFLSEGLTVLMRSLVAEEVEVPVKRESLKDKVAKRLAKRKAF